MANETLIIGDSNWGGKASSLLGYFIDIASKYYARFITFSRNSVATYINSSGVITTASANIPRVEYNALLLEPQRINPVINNGTLSGWTIDNGTYTSNVYTENTSTGVHRVYSTFNTGYSTNVVYCFSTIIKKVSGDNRSVLINLSDGATGEITSQKLNLQSGLLEGSITSNGSWSPVKTGVTTLPNGRYLFYLIASNSYSSLSIVQFRIQLTDLTNLSYLGTGTSVEILYPQSEAGQYPTSRIVTTGTSVTRLTDLISRGNLYLEKMITSKGGTLLLELANNYAYDGATSQQLLGVGNNTSGASADNIWVSCGDSFRASIYKQIAGSSSFVYSSQYDNTKIAVRWDGSNMDVFESGLQYVVASGFSPTQLQSLRTSTIENPIYIKQLAFYATPLNDATCASYTAFDSSVVSFLNATGIASTNIVNAINNLVLNYKGRGNLNSSVDLWSKTYAIYPFASEDTSGSSYNLKNVSQYVLNFNGTWMASSTIGIIGNGTDAYVDTNFNPFNILSPNSGRAGVYINSNAIEDSYDIGAVESGGTTKDLSVASRWSSSPYNNNFLASYGDQAALGNVANTDSKGLFTVNRNSSTITTGYKNGIEVISKSQTEYLPNLNLYIGASNNGGTASSYSTRGYTFALIGQGLTIAESLLEYQIILQFQKDMGRL